MPSNRNYDNYYKPNFYPTVAKDESRVAKSGKNRFFCYKAIVNGFY